MFEFWREATATSVPGLLCQSGRRRPENVSILSSLMTKRETGGLNVKFDTYRWALLFHSFLQTGKVVEEFLEFKYKY